jgi:hypothetical protein
MANEKTQVPEILQGFFSNLKAKLYVEGKQVSEERDNMLSEKPITINQNIGFGKLGVDATTKGGVGLGGSLGGNYRRGQINFPEEFAQYGFPSSDKFGKGLTLNEIKGYLNIPIDETLDMTLSGTYNPDYFSEGKPRKSGMLEFIKRF